MVADDELKKWLESRFSKIEQRIGRQAIIERHPSNPADMLTSWADVSKARSMLDWQPEVGLEAGIARLVDWYMAEREWACKIQTA
jgi:UDP-glucuronate 4-epimerase